MLQFADKVTIDNIVSRILELYPIQSTTRLSIITLHDMSFSIQAEGKEAEIVWHVMNFGDLLKIFLQGIVE